MLVFVFLFLLDLRNVVGVTHSLRYFYTASSGIPNFPSYVSVGFVDDVQISYCDSRKNDNIPKQDWMNDLRSEYPNYWKEETETCRAKQRTFKKNLEVAKQRYNQSRGVPIFQQMYGCEWDDETGKVKGYDQFGYDGEDFIALDLEGQSWIAPKPQAFNTKQNWENNRVVQELEKIYLTQTCVEWLMTYVSYGRSSLTKTDLPSVSFLQKNSSSPVCCHATGFYPNRAEMFWRKDGKEIHDGVVKEEILPNNDGTFQMSIYVNLSFVPSDDWAKYECVFQFSGFKENVVTRLERRKIRTMEVNSTTSPIAVIVAVMIVALVIAVTAFLCQRKKNERHSLQYIYTASSGIKSFPEFVAVGLVDGIEFMYYDSNTMKAIPKQAWMINVTEDDPHYWEFQTHELSRTQKSFINSIEVLFLIFSFLYHHLLTSIVFFSSDVPSVSFLQKSSSSPVCCYATGFYPSRAEMFWRRGEEEIHDGVDKQEVFPNNDGTFQMSIYIDLSSVPSEDWTKYKCVFQLFGVKDDLVIKLEKTQILSNNVYSGISIISWVILVAMLCLATVALSGYIYTLKKKNGKDRRIIDAVRVYEAQEEMFSKNERKLSFRHRDQDRLHHFQQFEMSRLEDFT